MSNPTQSYTVLDILQALDNYLQLVTRLQARQVIYWSAETRPNIEGSSQHVWYNIGPSEIGESPGPGRYGNQFFIVVNLHLVTRTLIDGAQRDYRKAIPHMEAEFKIIESFQNKNLFVDYEPINLAHIGWYIPIPVERSHPVSVGTMLIKDVPNPIKVDKEEGSQMSSYTIKIPAVLKLTN